jgi:hypothetical protein
MKFLIYEQREGPFLLKQERETWQLAFLSLAATIDHIRALPGIAGATVVVLTTERTPRLQFRL